MIRLFTSIVALGVIGAGVASACNDKPCDLDGNGFGGKLPDYAVFMGAFGTKVGDAKYNPKADIDGSGTVTTQDYSLLLKFCPLN